MIELTPLKLVYTLASGYPGDPSAELRDGLLRATGERWEVTRAEGDGLPSLREAAEAERDAETAAILRSPMVEAALAAFPEAELVDEEAEARSAGQGNRNWSKSA